jgi:CHAT domain-containing protein
VDNPLLRSGLALAGANHGRPAADGVLTALEAADLDLWGTKLVVLSACDTGVGEVKTGDGVYGLRRAFVLAGSETQVISLWPVPDRGTRDVIVSYYRSVLAGGERGDALRQAQLQMLRQPATRHPYYWAGFIVSGQWMALTPGH